MAARERKKEDADVSQPRYQAPSTCTGTTVSTSPTDHHGTGTSSSPAASLGVCEQAGSHGRLTFAHVTPMPVAAGRRDVTRPYTRGLTCARVCCAPCLGMRLVIVDR